MTTSTDASALADSAVPRPARDRHRPWRPSLGYFLGVAASLGGWLSLFGWLEEVGRNQAVAHYYGLPLSLTGDPRAAVVYAGFPLALVVAIAPLMAAAALAAARSLVVAGVISAVGVAASVALTGWTAMLWKVLVFDAAAGLVALVPASALGRAMAVARPSGVEAREWLGALLRLARTPAGMVVAASAALAVAIWGFLAIGDATGRHEASSRTAYSVLGDRACHPGTAVIAFGSDGEHRTVRVAHREPGDDSWTFAPGLFTVPASEPVVRVDLGRVAESELAPFPLAGRATVPARCD